MSEETSKTRSIVVTIIATAGITAALTMSIIAIAQTSDRTPSTPAATPMHRVAAAPQPQRASIVIRHQVRGCHGMLVNGATNSVASTTLRLTPGSTLNVTDNDIMPHKLVQLAGPGAVLTGAAMGSMGAKSSVTFPKAGVYSLTTKAGEDYPGVKAAATVGEDNTLKIRVLVS